MPILISRRFYPGQDNNTFCIFYHFHMGIYRYVLFLSWLNLLFIEGLDAVVQFQFCQFPPCGPACLSVPAVTVIVFIQHPVPLTLSKQLSFQGAGFDRLLHQSFRRIVIIPCKAGMVLSCLNAGPILTRRQSRLESMSHRNQGWHAISLGKECRKSLLGCQECLPDPSKVHSCQGVIWKFLMPSQDHNRELPDVKNLPPTVRSILNIHPIVAVGYSNPPAIGLPFF